MGEPRPAAVVPRGAWLALVLAGQAWGRGVRPRRAWHRDARSPGAEEARGADVIPRESGVLHLCSQREARKGFESGLWPQAANTTAGPKGTGIDVNEVTSPIRTSQAKRSCYVCVYLCPPRPGAVPPESARTQGSPSLPLPFHLLPGGCGDSNFQKGQSLVQKRGRGPERARGTYVQGLTASQ